MSKYSSPFLTKGGLHKVYANSDTKINLVQQKLMYGSMHLFDGAVTAAIYLCMFDDNFSRVYDARTQSCNKHNEN